MNPEEALRAPGAAERYAAVRAAAEVVTLEDLDNLRHMLGIDAHRPRKQWGFRNHFWAGLTDVPSMERLAALGWASAGRPGVYHATEAGCRAAGMTPDEIKRAGIAFPPIEAKNEA